MAKQEPMAEMDGSQNPRRSKDRLNNLKQRQRIVNLKLGV